jgi:flagellar L-ring protein precursor FlgH
VRNFVVLLILLCSFSEFSYAENLYNENNFRSLTSDRRAHQVGDLLTVTVLENSSASATAGTNTDKADSTGVNFASPTSQKNYSLGLQDKFGGTGEIARTGKLLAQISISIVDIERNGDFRVKGEQIIDINGEKQAIHIDGIVRPNDIDENNTILSSKISDAHITYVGDGVLAESQHKGWLSRLISILGFL